MRQVAKRSWLGGFLDERQSQFLIAMYRRFTDRARKIMQLANQEAQRHNHEYIGTEHVLLGLVAEASGVGANVLRNLNVDLRSVRYEVEKLVQSGPDMVTMGRLPQTPRVKKVIEYSMTEARDLGHNFVGSEHILLGLLREDEGVAAQILMNLGLRLEAVRDEVRSLLGHGMTERPVPNPLPPRSRPKTPFLSLPLADEVQRFLSDAVAAAHWFAHKPICTGFLLLGFFRTRGTPAARALVRNGVTAEFIRDHLAGTCPEPDARSAGEGPLFSAPVAAAIQAAAEEAKARDPSREIEQKLKAIQEEKEAALAATEFTKAARLRDEQDELNRSLLVPAWKIELDHVLLEILRIPDCEAARIVRAAGTTPEAVRAMLLEEMRTFS
jgi:ATP-dependent Clp protease ATP-binding subunit ClpA